MSPLVIRGDSMVSGFPTTRDIPENCLAEHTVLNDQPLVSVGEALRRRRPDTIVCAQPGHTSAAVLKWFEQTPQWWDLPTVFWFGRCEKPIDPAPILIALKAMTQQLTAPWIVCAVTLTEKEIIQGRTDSVMRTNSELQAFAGNRFVDPIRAVSGTDLLPIEMRLDTLHPNASGANAIAMMLLRTMAERIRGPIGSYQGTDRISRSRTSAEHHG